jgi:hypothetical protein
VFVISQTETCELRHPKGINTGGPSLENPREVVVDEVQSANTEPRLSSQPSKASNGDNVMGEVERTKDREDSLRRTSLAFKRRHEESGAITHTNIRGLHRSGEVDSVNLVVGEVDALELGKKEECRREGGELVVADA